MLPETKNAISTTVDCILSRGVYKKVFKTFIVRFIAKVLHTHVYTQMKWMKKR